MSCNRHRHQCDWLYSFRFKFFPVTNVQRKGVRWERGCGWLPCSRFDVRESHLHVFPTYIFKSCVDVKRVSHQIELNSNDTSDSIRHEKEWSEKKSLYRQLCVLFICCSVSSSLLAVRSGCLWVFPCPFLSWFQILIRSEPNSVGLQQRQHNQNAIPTVKHIDNAAHLSIANIELYSWSFAVLRDALTLPLLPFDLMVRRLGIVCAQHDDVYTRQISCKLCLNKHFDVDARVCTYWLNKYSCFLRMRSIFAIPSIVFD